MFFVSSGCAALGLLDYRGKDDGFCQFDGSDGRVDVVDEAGNMMDFVGKYLV
ncbi:hypothetical protein GA0061098_101212 [Bradyrhizobium shewense]|uniref:Uncharacterized protein n=1 Tax=Bradyrhizobium shewense TaxID=1761772 RepID=A0A1C3X3R7_9BRAD|nr:hypothetical protein GA0061098_101212 [Bradyrhizobium shewense]